MRTDGRFEQLTKKERLKLDREHQALEKNLAGIRDMARLPDVIFIIDSNKEEIAVHEANKLNIPVVAIVDTNCNPDGIDYIVPGNDDALRAVRLFAQKMADAIIEGQQMAREGEDGGAEGAEAQGGAGQAAGEEGRPERQDRGQGRGRDRDRDRRNNNRRRTVYVPPGAPPIPDAVAAPSQESAQAAAASDAGSVAAASETVPEPVPAAQAPEAVEQQ